MYDIHHISTDCKGNLSATGVVFAPSRLAFLGLKYNYTEAGHVLPLMLPLVD